VWPSSFPPSCISSLPPSAGFTLPPLHPKYSLQGTRVCDRGSHRCAENRQQAFQALLEACCHVLTHRTRTAEPTQPSPACSRRARLATGTEKGRRRKSMKTQTCGDKRAADTQRLASWREPSQVPELAAPRRSYHRLLTGPGPRRGAGPRRSRHRRLPTERRHRRREPAGAGWEAHRENGRFSPYREGGSARVGPSREGSHLAALALLSLLTEADGRQAGQVEGGAERCHQQESGRQQPHLPAWKGEGTMSRGCSPPSPGQRLAEAAGGGVTAALGPRRLRGEEVRRWAPS